MDEQRQQAYNLLIQSLLSCLSEEEVASILQENQDLLDASFVQTLEAVVEYFGQKGCVNLSGWMRNLANQLRESLNLPRKTPDLEADEQFLLEVLQATADSKGDAKLVYPLLAANTGRLNDTLSEILGRWATNRLAAVELYSKLLTTGLLPRQRNFCLLISSAILKVKLQPVFSLETAESISIAADIGKFSNLIQQFPLGNKANNIEIAITGYKITLKVFNCIDFPQDWATTQNNLGNAYLYRIKGDKAENLETAIAAFSAVLEIYTRADFPQDWARTQNNLGNAHIDRIKGHKAENLEQAITAFSAALEIYTRADFPQDWATTQNNLGNAYTNRIREDKAENLEQAIATYSAALEIYTRADFPQDWARTQNNLGSAYTNRIRGDQAENLEIAIATYSAVLEIYTRADFPQDWARTQNNLGNAYTNRIREDKAENLEQAIAAYTAALTIHTRAAFPQDWARTQNNLGTAYTTPVKVY
jgi:tetratricopeptide (TPR) repeat protein